MFQYVRIIIFDLIFQVEIDMEKALDQIIVIVPFTYYLQLENKIKIELLAYLLFNIPLINVILNLGLPFFFLWAWLTLDSSCENHSLNIKDL